MKSYLIIESNRDDDGFMIDTAPLKLKVRRGYQAEDLAEALDLQDDWVPSSEAERPYFFPGCNVPRFKVRENFNITIKPEYATAAFINIKTLKSSEDGFETMSRMLPYNGHNIMTWLKFIYPANDAFLVKAQSLYLNCEMPILIHLDEGARLSYYRPMIPGCTPSSPDDRMLSDFVDSILYDRDAIPLFIPKPNSIMTRLTCPIYDEKAILKLLNKDCIVVDKTRYEELELMGRSSDTDNLSAVMELMANCDFDKSSVYLLMLIKKFGHEMFKQPGINHINFKSLLEYLHLDTTDLRGTLRGRKVDNLSLDKLMDSLKSLGKWTSSSTQQILSLFPLDITSEHKLKQAHEYVVPGYVLKEEYISQLDDEEVIEDAEEIQVDSL